jgi:26S proteasome regulatory subunit N2
MQQLLRSQGRSPFGADPQTPGDRGIGSGAAAAAGVLTAVDEDGENDQEAEVPRDFDYFSDNLDDDEEEDDD